MKNINAKYKLLKAVLASTCMVVPKVLLAGPIINAPNAAGVSSVADDDTITITIGGNIQEGGVAGIKVIHKNNVINIDTDVANKIAIDIIGGNTEPGIDITNVDGNTVNVGGNRDIISVTSGIVTDGTNTTINNSGLIQGKAPHGVHVTANATDTTINNLNGATIEADTATGTSAILVEGKSGFSLINAGNVLGSSAGVSQGIEVKENFTTITNNPGGVIKSNGNNAIHINGAAAVTGQIVNNATIQADGAAATAKAITLTGELTGSITNNAAGVIQTTDGAATGEAIYIDNNFAGLNNAGKIIATGGAEAIRVNKSVNGSINNSTTGIIESAAGSAILIGNGLGGSISNFGGTIKSTGDAVALDLPAGIITGSITNTGGTIETGNNSAVKMVTLVLNGSFASSGTIKNKSAASFTLDSTLNGNITLDFSNSGTIENQTGGAINMKQQTIQGSFVNNAGATIKAVDGNALKIESGQINTNLNNAGTITNNSASSTVLVNGTSVIKGDFTNSGTIKNDGAGIALEMDMVTINGLGSNSGTSIIAGNNHAISWDNLTIGGAYNNTGLIQNNSLLNATIEATGVTKVTGGFNNTGTIQNLAGGISDAIDFADGANTVNIKLNQNGGTIVGDVLLAGGVPDGKVFDMNGGTITGDVFAANAPVKNILNLNGGAIVGDVLLGNLGDTVNLAGTSVQDITGNAAAVNDTVNITGGSFTSLDGGGGANNVVNINGSFTTPGTINDFQTVNVIGGTFEITKAITNVDTDFNVGAGTLVDVKGPGTVLSGTGTLTINGDMGIRNGAVVDMGATTNSDYLGIEAGGQLKATTYVQNPGAELNVELIPSLAATPHVLLTGAATLNAGSVVDLDVGGEFIPHGTVFKIIDAGAPGAFGALTVVQPQSALVSFTVADDGTDLTATSKSTAIINALQPASDITNGIASALDNIIATQPPPPALHPDIALLLGQLQTIPTAEQLEQALRTLVPNFNHSLATSSQFVVHRMFDSIGMRLEELLGLNALLEDGDSLYEPDEEGYNYGDGNPLMRHQSGVWFKPYASILDQKRRSDIEGYKADSVGLSIGADWRILDWATIGTAIGFSNTDVSQRTLEANKQDINSYHLSFYGHFDPVGPMYLNAMLGLARHRYEVDRTISVGTLTKRAESSFHGLHYAGKVDVGYAWFNGKYYISPVASMLYSRINMSNYSEKGAGGLDLVVRYEPITELVGAIGMKFAMKNEFVEATYVPQLDVFIHYDFQADQQESVSNFVAGSPAFTSFGIKPAQTSFTITPSFRFHNLRNMMFKVAYEFEAKKQFIAHTAYFKFLYKFRDA